MLEKILDPIINILPISEDLTTAGQPTRAQLEDICAAGYVAVVNLAPTDSPNALSDESELVISLGMRYIHIPVVWTAPTRCDLERFFKTLDRLKGQNIFVHCALNMRVSAFYFLYRVLRGGESPADALPLMEEIWQPNPTWQAFIDEMLEEKF